MTQRPDSDEQRRGGAQLVLHSLVDCEGCEITFQATWTDDSMTIEDMAEAPVRDVTCPECGYVHKAMPWPGWTFRSEAG
jgi:hypothetical protein